MVDDNERFSNSICSSQRHSRWRWYMCLTHTSSNYLMNIKYRPLSIKNGILVLVTILLHLPSIAVDAHYTSLRENRDLQFDNPSIEPISSDQPTVSASPSRSFQPSPAPSTSQKPSISPSRRVSSAPSLRPTTAFPPSAKPTDAPTESPSSNPTPIPTAIPTPIPETEDPTLLPTLDFTTISPTRQASLKPSVTVTQFISEIPTQFPTASPTLTAPTLLAIVAPPTDAPILSFKYKKTTLRVRDVTLMHFRNSRRVLQSNLNYELDANCTLTWQVLVQDRIKNELVAAIQEYEALNVELRDISSSSPSNKTAWSLTFDVFMEIRAANIEYLDPIRITVGAFDSQSDKLSYIEYLKATHCDEFDDVHSVSLHVPISREEETPSKSSSQLAAIYASISVGLAAIVMTAITICCYLHFRNKRRVNDLASADNLQLIQPTSKSNTQYSRYVGTPSIVGGKSKNSDVSTLGDPIPFGIIREQNDDLSSANESCSIEYDFKKAFLDLHSVTDSQMCGTVDDEVSATGMTLNDDDGATTDLLLPQNLKLMIALADDIVTTAGDGTLNLSQDETLSVEHEYEVIVPPGMLGLILESHTGNGRPMVNSIKPNTVLYSVVHIGDYIDAVDGVNVKMMSANDVSRLIVKKQEEVRILEFARSMKRKTYHL